MKKYLVVLLLIISCNDKESRPGDVMPQLKMQEVLWDMISAGEFNNSFLNRLDSTFNRDSALKTTYKNVFAIHGINAEQFNRSYDWYRAHPDQMSVILDSLTRKNSPSSVQELATPVPDTNRRKNLLRVDELQVN